MPHHGAGGAVASGCQCRLASRSVLQGSILLLLLSRELRQVTDALLQLHGALPNSCLRLHRCGCAALIRNTTNATASAQATGIERVSVYDFECETRTMQLHSGSAPNARAIHLLTFVSPLMMALKVRCSHANLSLACATHLRISEGSLFELPRLPTCVTRPFQSGHFVSSHHLCLGGA